MKTTRDHEEDTDEYLLIQGRGIEVSGVTGASMMYLLMSQSRPVIAVRNNLEWNRNSPSLDSTLTVVSLLPIIPASNLTKQLQIRLEGEHDSLAYVGSDLPTAASAP